MTAQKTLEITLWRNLPSIITNTIVEESDNGRFCCELSSVQIRNIDIFSSIRILRYLGYNVQLSENLHIDWNLDYGNPF